VTGRETGLSGCSHDIMDARMTSALAPALSPRRGRIVRRSFENNMTGLAGHSSAKPETSESYFLSWGERIKGEGGLNTYSTESVEEAKSKTGNPQCGLPVRM